MAFPHVAPARMVFFLGGHDLEILTIRELLAQEVPGQFYDHTLSWGAVGFPTMTSPLILSNGPRKATARVV